jgi:hypothetical protein
VRKNIINVLAIHGVTVFVYLKKGLPKNAFKITFLLLQSNLDIVRLNLTGHFLVPSTKKPSKLTSILCENFSVPSIALYRGPTVWLILKCKKNSE